MYLQANNKHFNINNKYYEIINNKKRYSLTHNIVTIIASVSNKKTTLFYGNRKCANNNTPNGGANVEDISTDSTRISINKFDIINDRKPVKWKDSSTTNIKFIFIKRDCKIKHTCMV